MRFALPLACRAALTISERLVPPPLRESWHERWRGELWQWTLGAAAQGDSEGRFVVLSHTREAVREAFAARFHSEPGAAGVREVLGHPRFCLALCALPVVALALASGGMQHLRRLAGGLPYPDASRVVVLAQGPPVFGVRLGFSERELCEFTSNTKTLEGVASYVWRTQRAHGANVPTAYVSANFFDVLRAGRPLHDSAEFLVSHDFWMKHLRGDPNIVGQSFDVAGRNLRLAGVLPADVWFLSPSIGVWALADADPAPPPARWWLGLRGAIARLRPGVTPKDAEAELHGLQVQAGIARRNFRMKATPVGDLVYAQVRSYGIDLVAALGITILWAAIGFAIDYRRRARASWHYWAFFTVKPVLLLCALFVWLFEFTSVSALGVTGGLQGRGGAFLAWWAFMCVVAVFVWAWRDQVSRCHVCLRRMRQPLRIGVPGLILLETAGEEVMCPLGHGSVYTSGSVLGSEMSKRWMGFEDPVK